MIVGEDGLVNINLLIERLFIRNKVEEKESKEEVVIYDISQCQT